MDIPLQIPCYLTDYKSMANGLRLWFDTQETIPAEILIKILKLHNQFGYLFFGVQQIKAEDIIDLPELVPEKTQKTPSQRLRGRMYVYYKKKFGSDNNFEIWYMQEIDKIGARYLEAIIELYREEI